MSNRTYSIIAALTGILCGFVTTHSFFAHSWASILFWAAVGLLILYWSPRRQAALYAGAFFGFFTIATWLISSFQGSSDRLLGFALLVMGLSLLGSVCGLAGAFLFNKLFRRLDEKS